MKTLHTSICGPFRHENLELFLFRGTESFPDRRFLPLHEALEQRTVIVHETGNVGQLEVENQSDTDLFIQAGDVVKGGRQDRTLSVDLVVRALGGRVPVPAFCVESRRWHKRHNESDAVFSKSDTVLASKALRLSAKLSVDQSAVWESVASFQKTMGQSLHANLQSNVSPSSYQLSMENEVLQKRKREFVEVLEPLLAQHPGTVGFAFAINGRLNSADFYGSSDLFRRLWSRQLDAAVTEALMEAGHDKAAAESALTVESIEEWLKTASAEGTARSQQVGPGVWFHTAQKSKSVVFDTVLGEQAESVLHRNIIAMN